MIGQMRDRITIKGEVRTKLPGASIVVTYEDILSDWTKVQPLTSSRELTDNQIDLSNGFRFNLRYRSSYTPDKTHIVTYEGKDYTINSIIEVKERKRYWQITAISNGQPAR